jgi:tRNA 2-thiocytidine biosynthesis protein TtcA
MDARRYDFKGIQITGAADADGDRVFDEQAFPLPALSGVGVVQFGV